MLYEGWKIGRERVAEGRRGGKSKRERERERWEVRDRIKEKGEVERRKMGT